MNIESWSSEGMDWDAPDPNQSVYYEALRLAYAERRQALMSDFQKTPRNFPGSVKSNGNVIKSVIDILGNFTNFNAHGGDYDGKSSEYPYIPRWTLTEACDYLGLDYNFFVEERYRYMEPSSDLLKATHDLLNLMVWLNPATNYSYFYAEERLPNSYTYGPMNFSPSAYVTARNLFETNSYWQDSDAPYSRIVSVADANLSASQGDYIFIDWQRNIIKAHPYFNSDMDLYYRSNGIGETDALMQASWEGLNGWLLDEDRIQKRASYTDIGTGDDFIFNVFPDPYPFSNTQDPYTYGVIAHPTIDPNRYYLTTEVSPLPVYKFNISTSGGFKFK